MNSRVFSSFAAEKKKIKKIEEDEDTDSDGNFGGKQKVTGSELVSVRNSVVVEHLVQDIQDKSSMQEFRISGFPPSHGMHGGKRQNLLSPHSRNIS